jgi:hypothetical protein
MSAAAEAATSANTTEVLCRFCDAIALPAANSALHAPAILLQQAGKILPDRENKQTRKNSRFEDKFRRRLPLA